MDKYTIDEKDCNAIKEYLYNIINPSVKINVKELNAVNYLNNFRQSLLEENISNASEILDIIYRIEGE